MQPPKYLCGLVGALICVVPYFFLLSWSDEACITYPTSPLRFSLKPCLGASYAFFFLFIPSVFLSAFRLLPFPDPFLNTLYYYFFHYLVSAIPVAILGSSLAMKRYTVAIVTGIFILLCTVFGWGAAEGVS
jgi:hypothetical protein